jgi:ribosome-binding factor A
MLHRDRRVADAIKDTVAAIITSELADPGIGFVTVTRCNVSQDLRHATVYLSVLGDERRREGGLAHIRHAGSFIRRRLGQRIKLRYLPTLRFELDDMLAHEIRIGEILSTIKVEPPPAEPAPEPTEPEPD